MDYLNQNFAAGRLAADVHLQRRFGFAHLYQGWRGTMLTAVLGSAFGMLYTLTGNLLAPVVVHAAVDLRLLIIVTPERMRAFGLQQDAPH